MNNSEKRQIIELLKTVRDAVIYAQSNIDSSLNMINDSSMALESILNFIAEKDKDKYVINDILDVSNKVKNYEDINIEEKDKLLFEVQNDITSIISKIENWEEKKKIKAVFLPYKLSMWTSLESIWKAADEDEECEAVVLPIPYHDINTNGEKVKICYEGDKYPDYINIKKFWEYDLFNEKPDIIFIHNPYDEYNKLTRVSEEYYSRYLRNITSMLVYVPYFTTHTIDHPQFSANSSGAYYANKIIAEHERVKKAYEECESNIGKVMALGSPKFDAIYDVRVNGFNGNKIWSDKVKGKKVFLLITTIAYYARKGAESLERVLKIYNEVIKDENCVLVWRPHPLEENWLKNYQPELFSVYEKIKNVIMKTKDVFIDFNEDYKEILYLSDGIFITESSLINEAAAMGKPMYNLEERGSIERLVNCELDYFIGEKDINEYINDVLSGKEEKKSSERVRVFNKYVNNAENGDCGKKIYKAIKQEVLRKKS